MMSLAFGGSDCEALSDGWLGQPVNGLSSLAYVMGGAYVLRRGGPPAPAAALVGVGVGSVLYHGPMPPGAGLVHDGSLVALAGTLLFAGWRRSLPRPGVVVGMTAVVGFAANLLSRTDAPLCRPESLLQGHAVWHVVTAVAAALWLSRPAVRPGAPFGLPR